MVSMKDVAQAAGVSAMTVSNVLTGKNFVAETTRAKVLAVVHQTGYQVNVAARNLRQGRTHTIGLAIPELNNHYFGLLGAKLVERLVQEGLRVVVEQTGASREGELAAITDSRVNAYDGLILSAIGLSPDDVQSISGDLPVVVLGERQDVRRFDHVEMANFHGARKATELLLDRGCRKILALGMPDPSGVEMPTAHREDAFRLRALGVRDAVRRVADAIAFSRGPAPASSLRIGADMTLEALAAFPDLDGVVAATDTLALGALRALYEAGLSVPGQVKVIGFDDTTEGAYATPSLSTVAPGHDSMVDATARLLLRRLADPTARPQQFVGPFSVIERESTAAPPADSSC